MFLSLPSDFRFDGLLGSAGRFLIFDILEILEIANEIVSYDTYIIYEKHLGEMLLVQIHLKIKIFSEV